MGNSRRRRRWLE
uniref:Uncharacterized protein n=1 Tax=Arundo donax TaxID=35708 RepID=A0A0A9QS13_ARUDO